MSFRASPFGPEASTSVTSWTKVSATGNPGRGSRWRLDVTACGCRGRIPLVVAGGRRTRRLAGLLPSRAPLYRSRQDVFPPVAERGATLPQVIHTDKLWSDGAALRELPVLHKLEHVQVVSTARLENLHRPARSTAPARHRRSHRKAAFKLWQETVQRVARSSGHPPATDSCALDTNNLP